MSDFDLPHPLRPVMDWLFEHVVLNLFWPQVCEVRLAGLREGARQAFRLEQAGEDAVHDLRTIAYMAGRVA